MKWRLHALIICAFLMLAPVLFAQPGSKPARCSKDSPPEYPEELRGSGIEGKVLLHIVVSADGCVTSAEVVRKLHPKLDRLAVRRVKAQRFEPARKDGMVVVVMVELEVDFKDPGFSDSRAER